jgi:hypothetical protein
MAMMNFMLMFLCFANFLALFQASLLKQFVGDSLAQIWFWMRYADMSALHGVHKNMVAALGRPQCPALFLKHFDESFAVHGGYYNHQLF